MPVSNNEMIHGNTTLHGLVDDAIVRNPDKTALVDGPSGASVTYAELQRRIGRIAAWLEQDGLRAGDLMATWAPNLPPVAAVTLAALGRGATVVPLSPAMTEYEAQATIDEAGVSVVVTVPPLVEQALRMGARRVVSLGDAPDVPTLGDLLVHSGTAPNLEVDPDVVAFVCSSSGTTGAPKGAMLTHRQLVTVCRQISTTFAADDHDVTLALAPWFHILGLTAELLVPLSVGATVVTTPKFDPLGFLDLLDKHAVTYIAVPPPVAAVIADHPASTQRNLDHLELVAVGGAPLLPEVHDALVRRLPEASIGQGWGLTESSGALCVPQRPGGAPRGTVGRPLPMTEVRVVDPDTSEPVADGANGELVARGPQMMAGYLNRPDETAEMFTPEGWLRTGDLGHIDSGGNVVIVGRMKELIKVNAYQVTPAEVEAALLSHPGVVDAAVVGEPHEHTGETPVAYLVVNGHVGVDDVTAAAAKRLAPYKRPTAIHIVDRLPRTPSGKLQRRLLSPKT